MNTILKTLKILFFGSLLYFFAPIIGAENLINNSYAYDPSEFMPVPRLCPDGLEYTTNCQFYGAGCNPGRCPEEGDTK